MKEVTKDDIREAFKNKRRKRMDLLAIYYGQFLFDLKFNAEYIATKISTDLEIRFTSKMLYNLRSDNKKQKKGGEGIKSEADEKVQIKSPQENVQINEEVIVFRNKEDLPTVSPFANAFSHIKKKTES